MVNPKVFSFNAQKVKFKKTYKGIDFVEKLLQKRRLKTYVLLKNFWSNVQ